MEIYYVARESKFFSPSIKQSFTKLEDAKKYIDVLKSSLENKNDKFVILLKILQGSVVCEYDRYSLTRLLI